jgi:ATP-dependent Zn protease
MMQNKDRLKFIADYLIEKETIDETTFEELLKKPIPAPNLEAAPAS